jgi:3-hydroxyisobutyrate dehydrogenase-like beta-hydroxyacid dehydrogenase
MGSVVASRLPFETEITIIDSNFKLAQEVAGKVSGRAFSGYEGAADADMVMLVLPKQAVNEAVEKLLEIVKEGTIILNMATSGYVLPELHRQRKGVFIYDAKIIGHAGSILRGEPGIIVVNCFDQEKFELIKRLLAGFGKIEQGDSSLVERINILSSTEGIRTAVNLKKKLQEMNVPDEWINVAIRTVCAGTMKSFTENDLGHFAQELVKKMEQGQD